MPRRVPITLVRLLAVACACMVPAAVAQAAPVNDQPTTAQKIENMSWTSLSTFQDVVVQAAEWSSATTGPEDADPLPSCTSTVGFRSQWYSVLVPEAAVLRVAVTATDNRYEPVVTILDPARDEVGCGRANASRPGSAANATAYVTPNPIDGTAATYLVRVAEFADNSASAGLPTVLVRFAARDVTAPHIIVKFDQGRVAPGAATTYDANDSNDAASQVNPATAKWEFHDKVDGRDVVRTREGNLRESFRWSGSGPHDVVFRVADFAGNESMYRFTTVVLDTKRPDVRFSLRPPAPGDRRLRITIRASESVRVRLLVTQVGRAKPLMRRVVSFWGDREQTRSVTLRGAVRKGTLVITGFARDLSGNTSALPQCVVDPVTGQGRCTSP